VGSVGKSLAEDLPMLMICWRMRWRRPAFLPNTLSACRQLVTGFKCANKDTRYMSGRMFRELLYPPEHPYYQQTDGEIETITAITRTDVSIFASAILARRAMMIVSWAR